MKFSKHELETYISEIYNNEEVKIDSLKKIGLGTGGKVYRVRLKRHGNWENIVLKTLNKTFGQEHYWDRIQKVLWAHSSYKKMKDHVRSIDVASITKSNKLKSIGDITDALILMKEVRGQEYSNDLKTIVRKETLSPIDRKRIKILSDYMADLHSKKKNAPNLYRRRIFRELIGGGDGVIGFIDAYPNFCKFPNKNQLQRIEKEIINRCLFISRKGDRFSQIHGDMRPCNIFFHNDHSLTLIDRSRGTWGEPADDISSFTIDLLTYSIEKYSLLSGPFEELFRTFFVEYLNKTRDKELLSVIAPFYAWRVLIIINPRLYPHRNNSVRQKLFNFMQNVLKNEEFEVNSVNLYLK